MATTTSPATLRCPSCGAEVQLTDQVLGPLLRRSRLQAKKEVERELRPTLEAAALDSARSEVTEELRLREEENAKLRRQLGELSKKGGPAQQLGTVREAVLSEVLQHRFPRDEVIRMRAGARGADVLQTVYNDGGQRCGSILWESKRASRWSTSWIAKLRSDQRNQSAEAVVLVSDVIPPTIDKFGEIDGVLVTTPDIASDLAGVLRQSLLALAAVQSVRSRRADLKGTVYDYVHGEFVEHYRAIIETAFVLRQNLAQEQQQLTARWQERDVQIRLLIEHLAGIYGEFRGLGAALPTIEVLELAPISAPSPLQLVAARQEQPLTAPLAEEQVATERHAACPPSPRA
jgi:hypothetical protein